MITSFTSMFPHDHFCFTIHSFTMYCPLYRSNFSVNYICSEHYSMFMNQRQVRGIKKDDSAILKGMQIHHNYIRPHQGLDGDTPADRSGIKIMGDNKWKTIIQNAASKSLDTYHE